MLTICIGSTNPVFNKKFEYINDKNYFLSVRKAMFHFTIYSLYYFLQRRFDFELYLYKRNAHLAAARSQVVCSTFTYAKQVCSSSHSVSQETCVSASMLFLHSLQWCQHTWQALIDFYSLFYVKLNRLLPKAVTGNHQIVFEILICISAE